jgi:NAD(P)-dependent dehydrogenase (short-subunit alcohol dehydrogenase family)
MTTTTLETTKTFGATSTTDEVLAGVDLTGKRALVTGVSAGLGVETARALAAHGAQVTGTARDLDKARAATAHIPVLELVELDLASLASVRAAADKLVADGRTFDIVIANAGVMAPPFGKTVDGFETQFGTNHLGHFVFVNRIARLIAPGGRFVSLASSGHRFSDVDLDDPNFERTPYTEFGGYGRSKTANILFAVEFDRRHKARGVRAVAVHPGGIQTELGRHLSPEAIQALIDSINAANAAGGDGRPCLRAPRPASGPQRWRTSMWWAGSTVRTATWPSPRTAPMSAAACAPTRSTRRAPRRCGRRARRWSARPSDRRASAEGLSAFRALLPI